MKYVLVFLLLFFYKAKCQQLIVDGSPVYNFHLVEINFRGEIQAISKLIYNNGVRTEQDTLTYIANRKGLFYKFDTVKLNLNDMFEGMHYDYNQSSTKIIDKSGKSAMMFDTSYQFDQNNFTETILFYRSSNLFIHKLNKNADTICTYMTRLFEEDKKVKRITYYHNKEKCAVMDNIPAYLNNAYFSEMYEFTYISEKGSKKISTINYYRTDKNTGKKILYASNKYIYGKNSMVKKIFFEQIKGIKKIKGETVFRYYPN